MIITPSFKNYVNSKDGVVSETDGQPSPNGQQQDKEWKNKYTSIKPGFIPPPKLRPVVQAFVDSGDVKLQDDTTKEVKLPKKSLYLTGGAARDFIKQKSSQHFELATNATPAQTAQILHSAGFRCACDPKVLQRLKLTFDPKPAEEGSKKTWTVKKMDKAGRAYAVTANVNGEEFDIETMRRDPKTGDDNQTAKEFVDNPKDDAQGRDFTMNAIYIELSKADGENTKVFDPTEDGIHAVNNGVVKTVGPAEKTFKDSPERVLRAIRFHGKYGKGDMHPDVKSAMDRHKSLDGVELSKIRDEFLKSLMHPDTDVKKVVKAYQESGIIKKLFPDIQLHMDIPPKFSTNRDKPLALAWLLQNNPIEKVISALSPEREEGGQKHQTGWTDQEKRAVLFLLALKQFTPEDRPKFLKAWKGTGLSKDQIRDWVEFFNTVDDSGTVRNRKPLWANHVKTFADNDNPLASPKEVGHLPRQQQGQALDKLEVEKFLKILPTNATK